MQSTKHFTFSTYTNFNNNFVKSTVQFFFFFLFFFRPYLQHMEVPRQGVEWELQLLAYTTATATPDPSHICDLNPTSRQCQIINPLRPGIEPKSSQITTWVCYHRATVGTPCSTVFIVFFFNTFFFSFYGHTCGIWEFPVRGQIRAAAAGLHHSHTRSEPLFQPIPQLAATLNPKPTE